MLERETERLLTIIEQQTIGTNEAIGVRDILAAEIPYPIKVFLRADVERMLNDELRRVRSSSRFNYHHREVQSLQRQANSILVMNFSFLREEFLQKVEDGIHLVLNYLLRPQWTLTNFLFNTNASILVDDLKSMLTYFGAYEYLKEVLFRYLEEKNIQSLTMAEFQNLIWRIDAEYVRRKSELELAGMTTPIYDFLHFSPLPASPAPHMLPIPTKALLKFFEDKRMPGVYAGLEQSLTEKGFQELTMNHVKAVLKEICRSNPHAFRVEETFLRKQVPLTEAPRASHLQRSSEPSSRVVAPPQELPPEPLRPSLPDLRQLISKDEHRKFIRKIFKKDDTSYASSLSALNAMTSWKEASTYIDKILIANDVDPYSSEAVRFSEVVYQRFFPKTLRR